MQRTVRVFFLEMLFLSIYTFARDTAEDQTTEIW